MVRIFPAKFLLAGTAIAVLLVPSSALAAGSEDAPPVDPVPTTATKDGSKPAAGNVAPTTKAGAVVTAASAYAEGKLAVSRKDWAAAVALFTTAAELDPKNADVQNMLGYSYRKSGDLKNAFVHYELALKLNPKHKGALEYQGEAYVESGQMAKAKANLAKLKSICGTTCAEYKDLAAFIKAGSSKTAKKY
jgi:Flp pilus assembly protein TadD